MEDRDQSELINEGSDVILIKKRLIEYDLPLADISEESAREKSIRHGHPSTLQIWWARRLLVSPRATAFAALIDVPNMAYPESGGN